MTETLDCFLECCGTATVPHYPQHICSPSCPLFQHRDVYVCRWSCNFHFCTQQSCNRLTSAVDASAAETQAAKKQRKGYIFDYNGLPYSNGHYCSVTGLSYAEEFHATFEQGARSAESVRAVAHVPMEGGKRGNGKRRGDGLERRTPTTPAGSPQSSASASASPSPPPGWPRRPRHPQLSRENEEGVVNLRISRMVPALPCASVQRVGRIILANWLRIKATHLYVHPPTACTPYTLEGHVQVELYIMASPKGESYKGVVYVAHDAEVAQHIPPLKAQPVNVVTVKQSKHHRTYSKQHQARMYEWIQSVTV